MISFMTRARQGAGSLFYPVENNWKGGILTVLFRLYHMAGTRLTSSAKGKMKPAMPAWRGGGLTASRWLY